MKLIDLKAGDVVVVDDAFTCMNAAIRTVQEDNHSGLFITCSEGRHFLDGQSDETGELVGISWPATVNT